MFNLGLRSFASPEREEYYEKGFLTGKREYPALEKKMFPDNSAIKTRVTLFNKVFIANLALYMNASKNPTNRRLLTND